jgi:hypothetical protein
MIRILNDVFGRSERQRLTSSYSVSANLTSLPPAARRFAKETKNQFFYVRFGSLSGFRLPIFSKWPFLRLPFLLALPRNDGRYKVLCFDIAEGPKRELLTTNLTIHIGKPMYVLLARVLICSRSNHRPTGASIWGRAVKYGVPVCVNVVVIFAPLFGDHPYSIPLCPIHHNNDNIS